MACRVDADRLVVGVLMGQARKSGCSTWCYHPDPRKWQAGKQFHCRYQLTWGFPCHPHAACMAEEGVEVNTPLWPSLGCTVNTAKCTHQQTAPPPTCAAGQTAQGAGE